jgi:hypothetical protein
MEEETGATTVQADDQTTVIWEELSYPLIRLSLRVKIQDHLLSSHSKLIEAEI